MREHWDPIVPHRYVWHVISNVWPRAAVYRHPRAATNPSTRPETAQDTCSSHDWNSFWPYMPPQQLKVQLANTGWVVEEMIQLPWRATCTVTCTLEKAWDKYDKKWIFGKRYITPGKMDKTASAVLCSKQNEKDFMLAVLELEIWSGFGAAQHAVTLHYCESIQQRNVWAEMKP